MIELIAKALLALVVLLTAVLLFGPYEAFLEGCIALAIVAAVLIGFLMYPRTEVFYVRTSLRLIRPVGNRVLEHDVLAVKVELTRLWLLFAPTILAVTFLVFFAAGGPTQFSFLNWIFSSKLAFVAITFIQYPPVLVLILLSAWISERRVLRDAEACIARSLTFSPSPSGLLGRVSYLFMGENGEYYAGECMYFGRDQTDELGTIVFRNVRTWELNKIAIGFLFHRLVVLGRGVTDLDSDTVAAQRTLTATQSVP